MAAKFCVNCGQSLTDGIKYCSECGTSVAPHDFVPPPPILEGHRLNNRLVAFLCYMFWVVGGIVFLNLEPYSRDPEVRFNAWQSIYFHLGWLLLGVACTLTSAVLGLVGLHFFGALLAAINLVMFVGWLILLVSALKGQRQSLPIVGELAKQRV